jgi:hypothetical protein
MNTLRQAAQQALEALESIPESGSMLGAHAEEKRINAIAAIKRTLAAPVQKPVASIYVTIGGDREFDDWKHELPVGRNFLYTTPPAAQPEQVAIPDCGEAGHADGACGTSECLPSFRRKTTPPAAKPEPVEQSLNDAVFTVLEGFTLPHDVRKILEAAYYTTPPAAQPEQVDCPECKAAVLYECVACSSNNYPPKPEQEPVAWMVTYGGLTHVEYTLPSKVVDTHYQPLYTTPPQRKPLTMDEIGKAWAVADGEHNASASVKRRITRAIEAAHGIKERNNG